MISRSLPVAILLLSAVAQAELPAGPGKEATVRLCSKCHSPEKAVSLHQTRTAWEETITKMVDMGAEGTDEEFNAIVVYLVKNYGPESPRPINVNKATAVELESALLISRAEAAAIVHYRTEKGDFKSIEDLRGVPGLDFKKIEAKKARLAF